MEEYFQRMNQVDLTILSPHIRCHVETLLTRSHFGLCHSKVKVINPLPSASRFNESGMNCDRFQLIIPYAGMPIECMVIFQSSGPDCPPDFLFADTRFFPPLNQIETLCSWDVEQTDGLYKSLKEIMQFYKKRQIQELDKYEHLSFEYLCLFQLQNFNEDDIEILVPSDPESSVTFLIRLHIDFRSLLPDFYLDDSDEDHPLLFITFPNRDSNRSNQRLYLSQKVESVLGIDDSFQLRDNVTDNYLARYIVALEEELKIKSELATSRYERRKTYFIKFLSHFDHSVIEYDIVYFTSMVLLLKEEDFHFIVEINLPDDFPMGTPAMVFRSIYHSLMGQPIAVAIDSYPYSPTWPVQKVLEETIKFIEDYVPLFKQDSSSYCYQHQMKMTKA